MSEPLKTWELVSIVLSALVMGVFWGPWVGLTRSVATLGPDAFIAVSHRLNRNLGPLMKVLMPAALLSTVPTLVISSGRPATFYPSLAGVALFVLALIVTMAVEVPIATRTMAWTIDTLPPNWRQLRDRWASVHTVRVVAGIAGVALLVAGAIGF
jgi:uncharacterized membrane protein